MRKLDIWHQAGLIDEQTLAKIRAFEDEHHRPLALWAVIGIGALAIGLGVISVVAANWEDVPGMVRLALHLALMVWLAAFLIWREQELEQDRPWGLEALLFVLAMLGMTFFGHLGQVYQTSSPLWQPLGVWLLLFGPVLLLRGQSWLTAMLLMAVLVFICWDYSWGSALPGTARDRAQEAWLVFVTALPLMVPPLAAWMRGRSARDTFWKRLEEMAIAYAVAGATFVCIFAGVTERGYEGMTLLDQLIRGGVALAAAALFFKARPGAEGRSSALILAAAGIVCLVAVIVTGSGVMSGILFMALWVAIGAIALRAGWRGLFQLAVGAVALRLIILSFELASDLLTSGFGLILAGIMILAIAWGAVRISREYAPPREGAE
ncbi:DUF2157 domain-containing protein [Parerythrobacter jejuensis]|nr:DUF2157 domain-containing protein [Parerythrobacter jejuensis]